MCRETGRAPDRGEGLVIDPEVEGGGKPNGPDHAQGVFPEPGLGSADCPEGTGAEARHPAVWADEGCMGKPATADGPGAPAKRVAGEAAPAKAAPHRLAE